MSTNILHDIEQVGTYLDLLTLRPCYSCEQNKHGKKQLIILYTYKRIALIQTRYNYTTSDN